MDKHTRIYSNPVIGHHVVFLQTAAETGGEHLQIEYRVDLPEPKPVIPLHIHRRTEERFEVLQGSLGVTVDKRTQTLRVGDTVVIAPGTAHTFWNDGPGELCFLTDIRPAGRFELYWETVFGLAAEGQVDARGLPGFLQTCVLAQEVDVIAAGIPPAVLNPLIDVFAALGRRLGYRASYPRFRLAGSGPAS